MKLVLVALSLLGAAITTTSSIWGATHKLFKEDADGKRRMLPSGRISILFTVIGLLITLISGYLGYQTSQAEAYAKANRENEQQRQRELEHQADVQRQKELADSIRYEERFSRDSILISQNIQTNLLKAHSTLLIDEAKIDAQTREIRLAREIILSGQPLRSLDLKWVFIGVDDRIAVALDEQEQDVQETPERWEDLFQSTTPDTRRSILDLIRRHWELYPFLHALSADADVKSSVGKPVLVLVSFDRQNNSVLSFGLVDTALADASRVDGNEAYNTPGSIEFIEDFKAFQLMAPPTDRTRRAEPPDFRRLDEDGFEISWALSPRSFFSATDLLSDKDFLNSVFPEKFRIMILTDIEHIPFRHFDLADPRAPMPEAWTSYANGPLKENGNSAFSHSAITLCFNQIPNNCTEYAVTVMEPTLIEQQLDDGSPTTYAEALVFECRRK